MESVGGEDEAGEVGQIQDEKDDQRHRSVSWLRRSKEGEIRQMFIQVIDIAY